MKKETYIKKSIDIDPELFKSIMLLGAKLEIYKFSPTLEHILKEYFKCK